MINDDKIAFAEYVIKIIKSGIISNEEKYFKIKEAYNYYSYYERS